MIKQEADKDKIEGNLDKEKINPYYEIIMNKVEKENIIASQMEQWSIHSNVVNYIQYSRHPKEYYDLDIKAIDQRSHRKIYDKSKGEER